ncbi:nucleotide-binding universal stress UspA family protein [Litoreibacter halocynthiae]|uniref:Nucleotide-binding universal stress UspA family protein n=1 Tax=Litoreibacter halocynthiae TaxID=1242689 RepID=A0A4V3EWR4_9RHOB|nr:universal stress protein [Litoreibacter halocynthiae]TDT77965.1 nucleotide-binding universal stress UspA family protein [Litoreibacter halocynthiae]
MKRILYATDLDAHSDRALHRAMMLSIQHDAELLIFHVTDPRAANAAVRISELEEQIQKSQLPDISAAKRGALRHQIKVVSGDPISELVAAVDSFHPDLVVMGPSRELTPMAVFYGTTADKAVARIGSPILVVKNRPYALYGKSLVAFDHTLGSRAALELAAGLAPDAELLIASVTGADGNCLKELNNVNDMVSGHVTEILKSVPDGKLRDIEPQVTIRSGIAGDELLNCAAQIKPDLLAFGRTQKTGLKSLVPGSTANLLLGHAACDVLIAGRIG